MNIYRRISEIEARASAQHPQAAERLRQLRSDLRDFTVSGQEFDDDLNRLRELADSSGDDQLARDIASIDQELQALTDTLAKKDEPRISFAALAAIIFLVWVLGFVAPLVMASKIPALKDSLSFTGTFGDTFGSVNALFAGLALAGVAYSIFVQRIELRNQRKELRLQRRELRMQREELEQNRHELARSASAQETSQQIMALSTQVSALMALWQACPDELRTDEFTVPLAADQKKFVSRLADLVERISVLDISLKGQPDLVVESSIVFLLRNSLSALESTRTRWAKEHGSRPDSNEQANAIVNDVHGKLDDAQKRLRGLLPSTDMQRLSGVIAKLRDVPTIHLRFSTPPKREETAYWQGGDQAISEVEATVRELIDNHSSRDDIGTVQESEAS